MKLKKMILMLVMAAFMGASLFAQDASARPASGISQTEISSYVRFLPDLILNGAVQYTVAAGDSLMSIAEKFYGESHGLYFPLILAASSDMLSHPDRIAPGMRLAIPDLGRNINEPVARSNLRRILAAVAEIYNNQGGKPVYDGLAQLAAHLPSKYPEEERHWSYSGDTGPDYWYELSPDYAAAKNGKAQSPINIVTNGALGKPTFHYSATSFEVENNGHTIEAIPQAGENFITLNGKDYKLTQFHFHTPSEHQIDGAYFDMELHLVHTNAEGNIAVVGFMIRAGNENEILRELFAKMPVNPSEHVTHLDAPVDLSAFITGGETLYRYEGSLTTPPCTEGVQWTVSGRALQISDAQLAAFRTVYMGNNRPIQALNGRPIIPAQN
ncbi:MAG: carbonic anhydrase family protein [Treponema sp.]|jgi:carbonic anhydrase|nr:carbonic anhydrase family protein [Treponema sp.]